MCIENILCDANFILFPEVQVYVYVYVYFPLLCLTMHPNMLYLNTRIVNRKTHSLKPLGVEGTNDESSTERTFVEEEDDSVKEFTKIFASTQNLINQQIHSAYLPHIYMHTLHALT